MLALKYPIRILPTAIISFLACSLWPEKDQTSLVGSYFEGAWPAWSRDGKQLVYSNNNDLWKRSMDDGKEGLITVLDGAEYYPSWDISASSDRLVFVHSIDGNHYLKILELNPYKINTSYESNNGLFWPSFSIDGKKIVFVEGKKPGIQIIDRSGGEPQTIPNRSGWGLEILYAQVSGVADRVLYLTKRTKSSYILESIPILGDIPDTVIYTEDDDIYRRKIFYAAPSADGTKVIYYKSERKKEVETWQEDSQVLRLLIYDRNSKTVKQLIERKKVDPGEGFIRDSLFYSASLSPGRTNIAYAWFYGTSKGTYGYIYVDEM